MLYSLNGYNKYNYKIENYFTVKARVVIFIGSLKPIVAPLLSRFWRKIRPLWLGPARQSTPLSTAGSSLRLSRSKF
jgi:hypothetical protein